jgi:cell division protein FtsW
MTSLRSHRLQLRNPFEADSPIVTMLIAVTALLSLFGVFMVLSASSVTSGLSNGGNFFADGFMQAASAVFGGALCLIIARWPVSFWSKNRNLFVGIGFVLQLAVLTVGTEYGGNRNWLDIGFLSFQPSEFLKLAVIVWFASWIHDNEFMLDEPLQRWIQPLVWVGIPIGMVGLGGDLGTTVIMGLIVLGMLAFAGLPSRTIWTLAALAGLAAFALLNVGGSNRGARFEAWIQGCTPEQYETVCWQTMHGLWALSSGGLFGLGPGSSRAKWSWLPHADSDYIFAIVGEELGMFGAIALIALFIALAVTLIRLVREFPQPLTRVLIGGVFVWIIGQAFVNIAVVLNVLPVLGVPLPFISSGGSALVANFLAIGVVISCVRHEERYG